MPTLPSIFRQNRGIAFAAFQMLTLVNADLRVDLLDPSTDQSRLGPRFCWGGYIWQISDSRAGALLSGPEWPAGSPLPWNGQGLPESFRHSTATGQPLLWDGPVGLAPGTGALGRNADGAIIITEPCQWQINATPGAATYRTSQTVGHWSYEIERRIELRDRSVRSCSRITNKATTPMKLEWFAHPFFALQEDKRIAVTVPAGASLREANGFLLDGDKLTLKRAFTGKDDGALDHLELPAEVPLAVELSHPRLSWVRFSTSFAPSKCVVWANGNTFSIEPFLALDLAPGESKEWTLTYEFGPAR